MSAIFGCHCSSTVSICKDQFFIFIRTPSIALRFIVLLHHPTHIMGRVKPRKYAEVKRMISPRDDRLTWKGRSKAEHAPVVAKETDKELITRAPTPASMFFQFNPSLGPPFRVLLDTNFINFAVANKIDIMKGMLDCLAAPTTVCVTDCVIAELQKLPKKYSVALKVARDKRFQRVKCCHKGTYADDCLVQRCTAHRIYIVATCDRDLKRRIRKIPGIPIMYISAHKFRVERLPETLAPGQK